MNDNDYMKIALKLAKTAAIEDEVPVGAVVVSFKDKNNPQIISKAYNKREQLQDPSAHAEFLAIVAAAKKLGK